MLVVYTHPHPRPTSALDLSLIPLDELADAVTDIVDHQVGDGIRLWFGYLEGWMLTPREEVLLRKAIRKFECHMVSCFPLSLSLSWQNEINTIYTSDSNGSSHTHDNGRSLHDGRQVGYGQVSPHPSTG